MANSIVDSSIHTAHNALGDSGHRPLTGTAGLACHESGCSIACVRYLQRKESFNLKSEVSIAPRLVQVLEEIGHDG